MQMNETELLTYNTLKKIKKKLGVNVRPLTIKLLEENIGQGILNFGLWQNCLNMKSKTQATKVKINETKYIT